MTSKKNLERKNVGNKFTKSAMAQLGEKLYGLSSSLEEWRKLYGEDVTEDKVVDYIIETEIDYVRLYLQTSNSVYCNLFLGTKMRLAERIQRDFSDSDLSVESYFQKEQSLYLDFLRADSRFSEKEVDCFKKVLQELYYGIDKPAASTINVLFVGDCLFDEVGVFLFAEARKIGVDVKAQYIFAKNPSQQRNEIRKIDGSKFDLVMYSPFSYEFAFEYKQLMNPRNGFMGRKQIGELVASLIDDTQKTLDLISDRFDCLISINNASGVLRGESFAARLAKTIMTNRNRSYVLPTINNWLQRYVENKNKKTFKHLRVLDENALSRSGSDLLRLGRYHSTSRSMHATCLSEAIASKALDLIQTLVFLSKKKLVVCDLDNTLWEGIIGEGQGVKHYTDRQSTLKDLKSKGVVLAINSKNDPANVYWDGGVLQEDSFVASHISWNPKVLGMKQIQKTLNLKYKDYVFVDDRVDECEMVREAYPEMVVLDATKERTWHLFRLWEELLDENDGMDRTQMYKEREQRKELLADDADDEDPSQMFSKLELKAKIREAGQGDLKRVTELINRTNQWNLCGSRTTFSEIQKWSQSPKFKIHTVSVSDRFGDMGMICSAVVEQTDEALDVKIYVLSCRVFGYGVETLLLKQIEEDSRKIFGEVRVRGYFKSTPQNKPATNMYRDFGFLPKDDHWFLDSSVCSQSAPTWMELH